MSENLHAQHGDLADLTVPELQDKARQQGISNPSEMQKEELLQALSSGGDQGGGSGGGQNG